MMTRDLTRRHFRASALLAGVVLLAMVGCDWADPTRADNPQTTPEDIAGARNPTQAMLPGLRAQFARALRATVVITETVSDNYSVEGTGLSTQLNNPYSMAPDVTSYNTLGVTGLYWHLQELRSLADFTIDTIAPGDERATADHLAEAHYYRGMAYLLQGENLVAAPVERDGQPEPHTGLLGRAIADLASSLDHSADGGFSIPARAALARAHRAAGNATEASAFAQQVLAADPAFLFGQSYSTGEIENTAWTYLVARALKEMQPLPRLDFLDPKYHDRESSIPVAKAEEMHLILAEVDLVAGDWMAARNRVADAVELARTRPTVVWEDDDPRANADLTTRPRDEEMRVRADENSPFREGLIQTRPGPVTVYTVSGTSLDADSVRALPSEMETRHAFWLARQEILLLEGRRLHDLGIQLPISRREIDASPMISDGDFGTTRIIPDYVPTGGALNRFTPGSPYNNPQAGTDPFTFDITIDVDMNRRLTENFEQAAPLLRD